MTTLDYASLTSEVTHHVPYHHGKQIKRASILPFVAWDGEGITPEGEKRQRYVLFGNSHGGIISGESLSTIECLRFIIDTARNSAAIHVGFSFTYDAEMILADLSPKVMQVLRTKGYCIYGGYRIEYKPRKWLQITRREGDVKISCRIWDVWGFFQTSFVNALRENLPEISADDLQRIEDGKAGRSQFSYADLQSGMMHDYMRTELDYLARMMTTLRDRLYAADLKIRHWHGPGAISSYALRTRGMARVMSRVPDEVSAASQHAYAGGRFELFQIGYESRPVYAYDIRSAYPSAMIHCPNLVTGQWKHYHGAPKRVVPFGVYRIVYTNRVVGTVRPHPFYYRSPKHLISYPNIVHGWYWSPEAEIALAIPDAQILEYWEYEDDGTRPFSWIGDVYTTRAQWKRDGNPSQMALKLLLNSMYGKTAQRVGWERTGGPPKWHQLEWAGFITSHARARLFRAMMEAHAVDSLLGVETDGIFTRAPLPLDIGEGLGQWECDEYEGMIYLQSGFYHKMKGGKWVSKYRGLDKGSVTVEQSLDALREWKPWESDYSITGVTTRFPTMGQWLTRKTDIRNCWSVDERTLKLGGDGKRRHVPDNCRACQDRISPYDMPHDLVVSEPLGGVSFPHHLPWIETQAPNTFRERIEVDESA